MGFEESLKEAKKSLVAEINALKDELARKECSLRKLESFLKGTQSTDGNGYSLTQNIAKTVYQLVSNEKKAITAKAVVKEFSKHRKDVNESTIRSTLYQVSKKQKPTQIFVNGQGLAIEIIKDGPTYDVAVVEEETTKVKHANS